MKSIAVLFARADSIYKKMPGCDVWDQERNALNWGGGTPVVAHPPCRAWGTLRHMANPRPGEKELAVWAIGQVRTWGGVLEHPKRSTLWPHMNLPTGTKRDAWGGFSILVNQNWWGHRAEKATMLYVCGIEPKQTPPMPYTLDCVQFTVSTSGRRVNGQRLRKGPEVTKAEREATPAALAIWLVELARRCQPISERS